jgi:hypothetical protein
MPRPKRVPVKRFRPYKEPILTVAECARAILKANEYLVRRGSYDPEFRFAVPAQRRQDREDDAPRTEKLLGLKIVLIESDND